MNKFIKALYYILIFVCFHSLESCTQLKKIDSTIRKTFGQVNRFKRQQKLYSKRLGLDNKQGGSNQNDSVFKMKRNPIQQKNMINEYGYIFEGLNGYDPGVVVNFTNKDSVSNVFEVQDESFKTIKKNREVFGWHPYWMGSSWKQYPFELLSTISYFSYNINSRTGLSQNPKQIEDWNNTKLIDSAKANNTRVLLTVSLHGSKNQERFLDNKLLWNNLYGDVSKLILNRNADGVDINFEDVPSRYKNEFVNFVEGFSKFLSTQFEINEKESPFISITLPAFKDRENYDIKKLDSFVNLFVIMGYDYNSVSTPDAVAPLQSEGNLSLLSTIKYYDGKNMDFGKTILALPYYGVLWDIKPLKDDTFNASLERRITYSEINKLFLSNNELNADVELDPISMSKIYRAAFEDNSIKEIHFDDAFTLSKKYDFAMSKKLKGVGVWALGYDNGQNDLWNLIEIYFSTDKVSFNDPITQVNGFPIRFAKNLVQEKDVFIAIIIFFTLALVVSFVLVLSDWRVRDSIMRSRINQLIVIFIGFVLLIPLVVFISELLVKFGFTIESSYQIYIGFFIGLLVFLIASKAKFGQIIQKP